jgi:hypothetical protein
MIDLVSGKLGAAINGCHLAAIIGASHGFARRENDSRNRICNDIESVDRQSIGEGYRWARTEIGCG